MIILYIYLVGIILAMLIGAYRSDPNYVEYLDLAFPALFWPVVAIVFIAISIYWIPYPLYKFGRWLKRKICTL